MDSMSATLLLRMAKSLSFGGTTKIDIELPLLINLLESLVEADAKAFKYGPLLEELNQLRTERPHGYGA